METHETDARAGLEAIAEGRRRIADRVVTPPWYHPALGLLLGVLVAVPSTQTTWAIVLTDVVAAFGLGVLVSVYRNRTGVWPVAKRRGPAARIRYVMIACFVPLYGIGAALEFGAGLRGALVVAGALTVVLIIVFGNRFDERLRAELRGEA
jgi:hypothetical protein